MHPFGREEAASQERLLGFFCECVRRGGWGLAQACLPQLCRCPADGPEKVEAILRALVACPAAVRCGQNCSPWRTAWLWLLVLEKWLARNQKTVPVVLRRETEFLLFLEELQKDVSEEVLKELFEAFECTLNKHTADRKRRDGCSHRFSLDVVSALRKLLLRAPQRAQALLEFFQEEQGTRGSSLQQYCSLQNIFVEFLRDSLKSLQRLQCGSEISEVDQRELVDTIYSALSMVTFEVEHQTDEVRHLFRELLDVCWAEGSPLREEKLLSCMLRKQSHGLLNLYSSVLIERTREKFLVSKSTGKGSSEQLDTERAMMNLFSDPKEVASWKTAYFYCLSSSKHFLEQILVTALTLLKREDFSGLSSLLRREFNPLSRLLVLLGWTHCQSLESAKALLWTLHKTQNLCNDSVLKDFCDGLWAQVEVLEWCIQQNSITIPRKVLLQHLHSLDCHTAVYSLHHLTNLLTLNEEDVIELLQKVPARDQQLQAASLPNALSQQRNLALFQAFCAMKYAIYALCVNSHKHSQCKDCICSLLGDSPEDITSAEPADCSSVFPQYLAKCHQFLKSIPAPLRLEVLENIFSLLFVSYSDLHSENFLPEDYAEDDDLDKKSCTVGVESGISRRSSASESPQHLIKVEKKLESHLLAARTVHSDPRDLPDSELHSKSCEASRLSYLDLKHFTSGVTGFLVDDVAMDAFLTLLLNQLEEIQSSLPWDSSNVLREELELVECLNLSASRDGFGSRVSQFSKYLSEAHWRYKVVMSNRNAEHQLASSRRYSSSIRSNSFKKRSRSQRYKTDGKEGTFSPSLESTSSELSTSTSEGSTSNVSGSNNLESRVRPQQQNPLIPMMLSPPESLLVSCVLRGNFVEAHQVALMFNLDTSPCYGELVFMERYQEAVREMARVENNIENQASDGTGGIRKSGSGRSTLQAIGNAAAAGMVFYSISDVTDKLLATSGSLAPTLQENFWINNIQLEHTDPLREVLEDLSPSAMAAFDLACTQCHLWKTCKQLLETAERRLFNSLETRGHRPDFVLLHSEGLKGFPAVLQQLSKILNYSCTSQGQSKSEISDEKMGSYFRCSIVDLLQACYPALTEESITNEIVLSQHLDQILKALTHVERSVDSKGSLLGTLVEQASLKPVELEKHLVWNQTQLLLRTLDQHLQPMSESNMKTNFVKIFFDYVTTLVAVVLRSLNTELDLSSAVKVGNPFILLQQSPSQLLSQLLFERQVQPDRLASLLAKEELNLNVQQVIVNCCCEPLSLCSARQTSQAKSLLTTISNLAHQCACRCLPDVEIPTPSPAVASEDIYTQAPSSVTDLSQNTLTASSLDFLKSQSKLTATVACLSASNIQKISKSSLSWMEFRGKREAPLGLEQISRECEALLKEFPILEQFLLAMFEPLQNQQEEDISLASAFSGKTYISLVLLGLHSTTAVKVLMEVFEQALAAKDWVRALKVLDLYSQDVDELDNIKDVVLSCATAEGKDGWQYLFPVKNATLRSMLALRCLDKWPLDACLEILAYCISDLGKADELKANLQSRKKELQVYQKILNLQNEPLWNDWQDLKKACTDDSQTIMNIILKAKDYELCEEWGHLYPVPREDLINLHREHLLHLLETGDMEKALQLLQRIEDPGICLAISEQSLDQHPSLAASHFLADYLTNHFYKNLTTARRNEIQALYMGSKVLLTLPELSRVNYFHLSSRPLLMLEQLLMNMKVDWVAVAVQTLLQLLGGHEVGFTVEDVDSLLSKYAEKALDFPYALKEKRSDSVIRIQENLSQILECEATSKSGSSELSPASFTGKDIYRMSEESAHTSISGTAGGKKKASLNRAQKTGLHLQEEKGVTMSASPRERSLQQNLFPQEFVPPEKPPPKQEWIPDDTETICMVCKSERFTMFNRRHHCRRCGRLVCSSCSTKKMAVEACRENPARVCDQCYSYYNRDHLPGLAHDTSTTKEDQDQVEEAPDNEYSTVVRIPKATELEWIFSLNEEENEIVRSEFYYEQAPSSSLCIAILSLHSNSIACGHQLIEHCCKLSQGLTNPEVDAGLLMDIMKQLLFSAKMMFVKAGRSQDLALCDSYISKVDVLNILVAAAYRPVPSLDQILLPAAVTRLRNRLLEAEYYQLAIEVSTKSGLDPSGAWHAWGMACLKAGNLSSAREKFNRCLKPPVDLNQLNHGSRLVQDVIQYLESTVKPVLIAQDDDYFATLRELEATLRTRSLSLEMMCEGKVQHNSYYQECLFYLHSYGTNLAIISFYMRHDCMREALLHLLNKESPSEVFIEGIFIPSYESGKLHMLENLLETIDPGLESWGIYLIATCKYLQRKNYYHILYELQQFMKDHVRAAMTCIRFFTHGAKSYTELGGKQTWLVKIKDHLKVYLQEVSRSSGRKKMVFTFRKKMSATDVSRHINTVDLQMEVTKFLHRCEISGTSQMTGPSLPTLFGNNSMKMDVACKVMLEGKNIEEGFGIAFRVLQDFQLEATEVYSKVAKQLVKQQKYSEIRQLLKCVSESGVAAKNDGDNIILNCLNEFKNIPAEDLDNLIQDMDSDENKIQAYLMCNKLRSAYLVSVRQEKTRAVQLVQHVRQLAENSGEDVVQAICTQWLAVHQPKMRNRLAQGSRK
ncbi:zinc finger FYVE domain-containing protein 26 isoform X1 [Cygnus olor]|uniref:zinc finger FYVE domain-containing protein 26 isoform X1 n=1 Tax=Cygnus olor TaxID=8869 RepID=UPI001ADDF097|nr:zinc finger FYVE domain-containing protein 26 isoform X1 [Cygnus olor]XP_040414250.1 zinc finger FYVE domain-containing protein 26 isoform X1 [Cygnus olor]